MRKSTLSGLCMLALATVTQAAPVTIVKSDVVYEVTANRWTEDRLLVARINEPGAIAGAAQLPLQFSGSLQELEVLEAYTTTRDGRRIDVPQDRIVTQQTAAGNGALMFNDHKIINVVFPQLEVGATTTLHYRLRQRKPFLPGMVNVEEFYSRFVEIQSATLTVRAPARVKLNVIAREVQGGAVPPSRPGIHEWRWTHGPTTAEAPEPGSIAASDFSPGVMVSAFREYAELAQAYGRGAARASRVTSTVRKLADQITAGIPGRREQAEAIYRWVTKEIRYVAISIGVGGFVPHRVDEILKARYGDCKDMSTLLISLMSAKDIHAVPVLLYAGDRYEFNELPTAGNFNHAIAYVPEFDLFLDGTLPMARFDALPESLGGRSVLVTGDSRMKAEIRTTPRVDPASDRTVSRTVAVASADGTVAGTTRVYVYGGLDSSLRTALSMQSEQSLPQIGTQLLAGGGQTGAAKLVRADLRDFTQSNLMTLEFTTPGRINIPGPGALVGPFGAQGRGARAFVSNTLTLERKFRFPCPTAGFEDYLELALPEGMRIGTLPPTANVESRFGKFTASYELKDGRLLVAQKLQLDPPQTVCTAEDHQQLRQFARAVDRELRRQILYQ